MLHMQAISHAAQVASQTVLGHNQLKDLRIQLIADAGAAVFVLLVITTVSVYKPWGRIYLDVSLPRFKATTKRPMGFYLFIGFIVG
jgi:subtilisin-like proprotein convertase family protein